MTIKNSLLIFYFILSLLDPAYGRGTLTSAYDAQQDAQAGGFDHIQGILDQTQFEELSSLTEIDRLARLEGIIGKIDIDGDGELDESELEQWIRYIEMRFVYEDTERQLPIFDLNSNGLVTKDEIREVKYNPERIYSDPNKDLKKIEVKKKQDFRRFNAADKNGDGNLDRDEFGAYLHPASHTEMMEVTALETIEELDHDSDGFLNLDEYLGDMKSLEFEEEVLSDSDDVILPMTDEDYEDEPDESNQNTRAYNIEWLQAEKEAFISVRDVNGDGVLDLTEVMLWQNPPDYSVVTAEAKYLIEIADLDRNGMLNKTEVLQSYDVFVQSSVTEWGASLLKHDEL